MEEKEIEEIEIEKLGKRDANIVDGIEYLKKKHGKRFFSIKRHSLNTNHMPKKKRKKRSR